MENGYDERTKLEWVHHDGTSIIDRFSPSGHNLGVLIGREHQSRRSVRAEYGEVIKPIVL